MEIATDGERRVDADQPKSLTRIERLGGPSGLFLLLLCVLETYKFNITEA